jgi:hypothetical protein
VFTVWGSRYEVLTNLNERTRKENVIRIEEYQMGRKKC